MPKSTIKTIILSGAILFILLWVPQHAYCGICDATNTCCTLDWDCAQGDTCISDLGLCSDFDPAGGEPPELCDNDMDCNNETSCLEFGNCSGGDNDGTLCFIGEWVLGLCSNDFSSCQRDADCEAGSFCTIMGQCPGSYCVEKGTPCETDADCPAQDSCYREQCDQAGPQGQCSDIGTPCRTDSHCSPTANCVIYKTCVGPSGCSTPPTECYTDEDCTAGETCSGNYPCCDQECGPTDSCPGGSCDPCADICTSAADCDDDNLCTTDTCVTNVCVNTNNTEVCDDGDICTTGDACANGACVSGQPMEDCAEACSTAADCDDDNPCTTDTCVDHLCINANNTETCDDENHCTIGDICASGACVGGQALDPCPKACTTAADCDDTNLCTTDTCVDLLCANTNNTDPCDDGNSCTSGDICADGACVSGATNVCAQNNSAMASSGGGGGCMTATGNSSWNGSMNVMFAFILIATWCLGRRFQRQYAHNLKR